MSTTRRGWVVIAGVLVLLVAGSSLVVASPDKPPARPQSPVTECDLVKLGVYETDAEFPSDLRQEQYTNLTDSQQTVFDEARAANGDFVRFDDESRMAAADTLPHTVVLEGKTYRANSVRVNCWPWYMSLTEPIGYVLVGLGVLIGGVFSWRRVTY